MNRIQSMIADGIAIVAVATMIACVVVAMTACI